MTLKLPVLIVAMLLFGILRALVFNGVAGVEVIDFPALEISEPDLIDLSGGCGGFTDCTEYLGNVFLNIGNIIIAVFDFVVSLLVFVFEISLLVGDALINPLPGAPILVNGLITGILGVIVAFMIFRMSRTGDTNA